MLNHLYISLKYGEKTLQPFMQRVASYRERNGNIKHTKQSDFHITFA